MSARIIAVIFCSILLLSLPFLRWQWLSKRMRNYFGRVIIVNGPSASGKSSIIKAFQEKSDQLWLGAGIDHLYIGVIPSKFLDGRPEHYNVMHIDTSTQDGKKIVKAIFGKDGLTIINGMHRAIAAYARSGNNVIVDYINYNQDWIVDLKKTLEGIDVTWVGVNLSLETLEDRETKRATSPEGHARSHYHSVHQGITYDLMLDVDTMTPEEAADKLIEYINK